MIIDSTAPEEPKLSMLLTIVKNTQGWQHLQKQLLEWSSHTLISTHPGALTNL